MAGSYGGSHDTGLPNPAMEMCFELEICPDLIMAAIAAAAAAAFYIIYEAISMKGKRKRSLASSMAEKMSLGNMLDGFYVGNESC